MPFGSESRTVLVLNSESYTRIHLCFIIRWISPQGDKHKPLHVSSIEDELYLLFVAFANSKLIPFVSSNHPR